MSKHHEIKCWPKYFERVAMGTKTFEVRVNDRDYQAGDTVTLVEYDPEKQGMGAYSGKKLSFKIGYVLVLEGYATERVVFSLLPAEVPHE